jgi:hypothetical protein
MNSIFVYMGFMGPNGIKTCRVTLQVTMPFATLGIKAENNFTLQFILYKKFAQAMI